ncbi:MAG: hypothetical protein BGN86_09230 [Caulobacterales bacterium 68-7]|nr:MAG: hypothetical protein BGN86_09230 [Caulobacterales bacterium 68-7]
MKSIIERAHEMARTGAFATMTEIKAALKREGYSGLGPHLDGKATKDHLKEMMRAAKTNSAVAR